LAYWFECSDDGIEFALQIKAVSQGTWAELREDHPDAPNLDAPEYAAIMHDINHVNVIHSKTQKAIIGRFSSEAHLQMFNVIRRNQHVSHFRASILWPSAFKLRSLFRTINARRREDVEKRPMCEWTKNQVDSWLAVQWKKESMWQAEARQQGCTVDADKRPLGKRYHTRRKSFMDQRAFSYLTETQFTAIMSYDMDGIMLSELTAQDLFELGDAIAMTEGKNSMADRAQLWDSRDSHLQSMNISLAVAERIIMVIKDAEALAMDDQKAWGQ
jgi:hypothetical protein